MRSCLGSAWLCSTTVARRWIDLGRPGVIVNVATTEGIRGCPNWSAYSAAKAGMINLTKTLSSEWGPHGIRINAVAPDYTPSPGTDFAGRRMNTDDPGSLLFRRNAADSSESLAGIAPFIPLRRYGTPDDTAALAIFLASEMSAWITGQTIVVDGGALDWQGALEQVGGNEAILAELAGLFVTEYARHLEEMKRAIGHGDSALLRRAAHTLKGSAAVFLANSTVEAALRLEIMAREGDLEDVNDALAALERAADELLPALKEKAAALIA